MAFYPTVPAVVPRGDFSKPCSALQEMIKFEKQWEARQHKTRDGSERGVLKKPHRALVVLRFLLNGPK